MPRELSAVDKRRLVELLARLATAFPAGARKFFADLVERSEIPVEWKRQQADVWFGDALFDARQAIKFASAKGTVPNSGGRTTLGSLFEVLLEDAVGVDDAALLAALTEIYQLAPPATADAIRAKFGIPSAAEGFEAASTDFGPAFLWRGPSDEVHLQSWLKPEPPLLDVGFLANAIRSAAVVCRVDVTNCHRKGTGVRVGTDLVLTNHHVLRWHPSEDLTVNGRATRLYFSAWTGNEGEPIHLAQSDPVCQWNQTLDYVVLRIDPAAIDRLPPSSCKLATRNLRPHDGVHILQHPFGESMKLAISASGITSVIEADGLVQYVTTAAGGSSGAPCFNDDWEVVALHHAQRARPFGRVGEGILLSAIKKEIALLLG
jgi:hypothetical protein